MSKYQGRVDPIQLLRNFTMQRKKVKLREDYLYFESVKLRLNTETPWQSQTTNKRYNLGSLWLLLDQTQIKEGTRTVGAEYRQRCMQLNIQFISLVDRDEVLDYFHGVIQHAPSINQTLKMEIAQNQFKKDSLKNDEDPGGKKKVKQQSQSDQHLRVLEWLSHFSKPVTVKHKALRSGQKSFEQILRFIRHGDQKGSQKSSGKNRITTIYEKKKNPIIIVPEVSQPGNVCMKNIRKLLEDGQYAESSQCPDISMRKMELSHNLRGKNIFFDITNNPSLLTPLEWECVVAVFVLGRQTQFSSWPESNVTKIFSKMKGFLLKYNDTKLAQAKDWNVKVINIQKLTRYEDMEVQKFIWDELQKILFSTTE